MPRPGRARPAQAVLFILFLLCPPSVPAGDRLAVVASLFPQYDFARTIAGERAEVSLLLPPGSESHSYEPTPTVMKTIAAADLFIYTGEYMEPWAKRVADAATLPGGVRLVDASAGIELRPGDDEAAGDHHDGHHDQAAEDHYHEFDPHIWLDPLLAMRMTETIEEALANADPDGAAVYAANAAALREKIGALHEDFAATVATAKRRTLVFGERFAFAYFFSRYGLEEVGPYKSCAPGAEPGLRAVIETVKFMRDTDVRHIYREAMTAGRISDVLRQETGADILAVDSMHTLSAEKSAAGLTYVDVMRGNMRAFAEGLE